MDAAAVFDRSGRVPPPPRHRLLSELRALALWRPPAPALATLPRGGGGAVLVIPAFLTGDRFTLPLRRFLAGLGHPCHGWGLGLDWGPTPRLLAGLRRRLRSLVAGQGGAPVAVVGLSLGGMLARDLAHAEPGLVRHVATLGSPLRLPTASPLAPLFHPLLRRYADDLDLGRLARRPPVPATVIWARQDGLVAWKSCLGEDDPAGCFAVDGTHMTLARNPAAQAILARRLA